MQNLLLSDSLSRGQGEAGKNAGHLETPAGPKDRTDAMRETCATQVTPFPRVKRPRDHAALRPATAKTDGTDAPRSQRVGA